MAATKVAAARMKVAQVPKPGADFQIVEREIPKLAQEKSASRSRPVEFAIAMCLRRKAVFHGFSIRASRDTRLRASLTNWARVLPCGKWDSVSAWAGMARMMRRAFNAGAGIFATAGTGELQESASTADTRNTW